MPHYLLSVCYPAGATPPEPAALDAIMARVAALNTDMRAAGVWVFGGGLHDPASSTVVVGREGEVVLSPSWSIHSGAGTANYTFIWGMAGENQNFGDMDHVPMAVLR